jgi:lipopolysaccharide biosynthesis glycosyltransferase
MKHALYSGSRNLYGDMQTAAKSLIANSDVDKVWLLVEDDTFDFWLPDFCEVVNVSGQTYFPKDSANMKTRFSYLSLMRAALALMPELAGIDRILSLDVDTVCVMDVSHIWDMPIDDCYFSASREDASCFKGMLYCNTGVTLYNLEKLRDGKAQEVVDALNWRKYDNIEQDVFSFMCQGHIHDMPSEYNATRFTDPVRYARIKHYAGYKAEVWRNQPPVTEYRHMPWKKVLDMHEKAMKHA